MRAPKSVRCCPAGTVTARRALALVVYRARAVATTAHTCRVPAPKAMDPAGGSSAPVAAANRREPGPARALRAFRVRPKQPETPRVRPAAAAAARPMAQPVSHMAGPCRPDSEETEPRRCSATSPRESEASRSAGSCRPSGGPNRGCARRCGRLLLGAAHPGPPLRSPQPATRRSGARFPRPRPIGPCSSPAPDDPPASGRVAPERPPRRSPRRAAR